MKKVYLAGAIRTDLGDEDFKWRRRFMKAYEGQLLCLVPSDCGVTEANKLRRFTGSAYMTYRTDLNLVEQADLVVANLLPMNSGYPSTGTIFELGYARAHSKLILVVADVRVRQHPFIAFGADGVFGDFGELEGYLDQYLEVTAGKGGGPQQ